MTQNELIKKIQKALNEKGENLSIDGDMGLRTQTALLKYEVDFILRPIVNKSEGKKSPPWYLFAKKYEGSKETDPTFSSVMVPKWKLFGMNLGTISKSWAAWCGLAMAVALAGTGVDYAKNGALAKNWGTYGIEIDWKTEGIPQGAIVRINHGQNCASASGNHVAQANGDCSPADLLKQGSSIDLYGGNQGNSWKVSSYSTKEICNVRWPKDVKEYPKPGPILISKNCSSKNPTSETTR